LQAIGTVRQILSDFPAHLYLTVPEDAVEWPFKCYSQTFKRNWIKGPVGL